MEDDDSKAGRKFAGENMIAARRIAALLPFDLKCFFVKRAIG